MGEPEVRHQRSEVSEEPVGSRQYAVSRWKDRNQSHRASQVRNQKSEVRNQKSEIRSQSSEGRGQWPNAECGMGNEGQKTEISGQNCRTLAPQGLSAEGTVS